VSRHDRGTQGHPWVACRKYRKINVGLYRLRKSSLF